jgi:Ca2+-binding EF-hand superfamily protein
VDDKFRKAFDEFDKDGSGLISREELKEAMAKAGENLTEDEVILFFIFYFFYFFIFLFSWVHFCFL